MTNTLRTHEENKNKFCWLKDNLSPEFASSTQNKSNNKYNRGSSSEPRCSKLARVKFNKTKKHLYLFIYFLVVAQMTIEKLLYMNAFFLLFEECAD